MSFNHLILHVIERTSNGDSFVTQLRTTENPQGEIEQSTIDELSALFDKSTLNIGEFSLDDDTNKQPAFEQTLLKYYDETSGQCRDFVTMTTELAQHFKAVIESKQLHSVKGGTLIFCEYTHQKHTWLTVAILKKVYKLSQTEQLNFIKRLILDFDKLHLGATINLTQWKNLYSNRYIRFKAGLAQEVRDYFEAFIGCRIDKAAAKLETKNLKAAIISFAEECKLDTNQKVAEAHSFIVEQRKNKQPILLSSVAKHVFPDATERFLGQAQNKRNLSEEIAIHPQTLRSYTRISARGKDFTISFDRDMLGESIRYENETLIITHLPKPLKDELDAECLRLESDTI